MTSIARLVPLALAALLLAACTSGLTQDANLLEKRFYVLRADQDPSPAAVTTPGTCRVKRLTVSPGFAGREIVYRVGENSFESDYYNVYHSTPADLISQATRQWLDDAKIFDHVAETTSEARPDYILEGNVVTLHGDFSNPDQPLAVLEMQFFLLKDQDFDFRITMDTEYRQEIPIADKSAAGLVQALNTALTHILTQLQQDLSANLP